jgi:hypothetical protein
MLLSGNPCVARISFEWLDQMREVTCDEVGREESRAPVVDDLGGGLHVCLERIAGCSPEMNRLVACSTARCEKTALPWTPCDSLHKRVSIRRNSSRSTTYLDGRCMIHLLPLWRRRRQALCIRQHRLPDSSTDTKHKRCTAHTPRPTSLTPNNSRHYRSRPTPRTAHRLSTRAHTPLLDDLAGPGPCAARLGRRGGGSTRRGIRRRRHSRSKTRRRLEPGRITVRMWTAAAIGSRRTWCPDILRTRCPVSASQSSTSPWSFPMARNDPSPAQETEQTSGSPSLQTQGTLIYLPMGTKRDSTHPSVPILVTSPVSAFHTYANSLNPIATLLLELHEIRFK